MTDYWTNDYETPPRTRSRWIDERTAPRESNYSSNVPRALFQVSSYDPPTQPLYRATTTTSTATPTRHHHSTSYYAEPSPHSHTAGGGEGSSHNNSLYYSRTVLGGGNGSSDINSNSNYHQHRDDSIAALRRSYTNNTTTPPTTPRGQQQVFQNQNPLSAYQSPTATSPRGRDMSPVEMMPPAPSPPRFMSAGTTSASTTNSSLYPRSRTPSRVPGAGYQQQHDDDVDDGYGSFESAKRFTASAAPRTSSAAASRLAAPASPQSRRLNAYGYRRMPSMVKDPCSTFLPAVPHGANRNRMTIVLDLDETLVYGRNGPIIERPGTRDLLTTLGKYDCEVVVWTAAERQYAHQVISQIDSEGVIEHCVYRHSKWWTGKPGYSKNLRALGRNLQRTLLIDNSPDVFQDAPQNGILVSDFEGRRTGGDRILHSILDVLLECIQREHESVVEVLSSHPYITRRSVPLDHCGTPLALFTVKEDRILSAGSYHQAHHNRDSPERTDEAYSPSGARYMMGSRARTPPTRSRW